MYLSVEACLSPSLPFAVFALRLVGCDNVCCSSLVLSIMAGSGRFPAVNSQSIYVPFGLVNSKKNGCDNVCCSSLVLSITAGSGRFPAVNSQSIYVPFGLVNTKKLKKTRVDRGRRLCAARLQALHQEGDATSSSLRGAPTKNKKACLWIPMQQLALLGLHTRGCCLLLWPCCADPRLLLSLDGRDGVGA